DDGRSAGKYIGVALQDVVRDLAFQAIQQRRVAIHVIEVFQQAEAIDLSQVGIGFLLRQGRGDFDGDLLITAGGLQRRVIRASTPVEYPDLRLFHTTDLGERPSQVEVEAGGCVREAQRFVLHAVHQDYAYARECVVIEFADRLARQLAPGKALLIDGRAAIFEECQRHGRGPLR